ncbi:MAG: PilZ domain-containing protein [Gammaproteobacteria bacterium]|nr:PilZ domain-containing protein [Gammaproteobacteria bacterium]
MSGIIDIAYIERSAYERLEQDELIQALSDLYNHEQKLELTLGDVHVTCDILHVDYLSRCIFVYLQPGSELFIDDTPDKLWVTGDYLGNQLQFMVAQALSIPIAFNTMYRLALPDEAYYIHRRRHIRKPVPDKSIAVGHSSADYGLLSFQLHDISEAGAGMQDTVGVLVEKQELLPDWWLNIPTLGNIRVDLQVVNIHCQHTAEREERFYMGCQFLNIDQQAQQRIRQYIKSLQ